MTDVLDALLHVYGPSFSEAYEVRTFVGYRRTNSGESQRVTVEIHDAGPANPGIRYSCYAVSDDGKRAPGSPQDTIEHALAVVHWYELDAPVAKRV